MKSEIEKFEKKQLEEDLKAGNIPDVKATTYRLLIEEIDFFMKKKVELLEENEKLLMEKARNEQSDEKKQSSAELDRKISQNKSKTEFFDKQISVAFLDYRSVGIPTKSRCLFFVPINMNAGQWKEFMDNYKKDGSKALLPQ